MADQEPQKNDDSQGQYYRSGMRWIGYGIELSGVTFIFTYAGWWADQWFGHKVPWLMFSGLIIAFVGVTYLLFKETAKWRK